MKYRNLLMAIAAATALALLIRSKAKSAESVGDLEDEYWV